MHSTILLTIAFALCGTVLASPAPTRVGIPAASAVEVHAPEGTPDCTALEEYCKCKTEDFNCQTDPSCEWCRDHNAWPSTTTNVAAAPTA
ncbi:uncharacterized protein F4822DRAFT_64359 [Hypoxylon trugodes]|uniref:uncharacterized protein n=1 Tax=Hypoxylon trugodes TaxID=326681 RepID=UPI0021990F1E|nr:uncharacterized protein F4822DRAFT_64359 [Hypoxylon trugodes]KAI1384239.1 hypothetical protein F4822DRAFT_64359 [Hypoxylon trugodes]